MHHSENEEALVCGVIQKAKGESAEDVSSNPRSDRNAKRRIIEKEIGGAGYLLQELLSQPNRSVFIVRDRLLDLAPRLAMES